MVYIHICTVYSDVYYIYYNKKFKSELKKKSIEKYKKIQIKIIIKIQLRITVLFIFVIINYVALYYLQYCNNAPDLIYYK